MWLYKHLVTKAILQQSYTVYPGTDHCQLCGLVHTSRGRCHLHAPVTSHLSFLASHQCWKYLESSSFWQYKWRVWGWMWFPVTVVWREWFKSFQHIAFGSLPYPGTDDGGLCQKIRNMRMDICSLKADLPSISLNYVLSSSVLALILNVMDQGYWLQLNELYCSLAVISDLFWIDIQGNAKAEFSYLRIFQVLVQRLHVLKKKRMYFP